jgi:hypothetical protein
LKDLSWISGVLVVAALSATLNVSGPTALHGSVLGVGGVCLGDSRAKVDQVLGKASHVETSARTITLYYGLKDPDAWYMGCETQVDLGEQQRVLSVAGDRLTDAEGRTICLKGTTERELRNRLGKRDWVSHPWCGNDTNEYHYFKKWNLVVWTDIQSRRATLFGLDGDFPTEPVDGEPNVSK